MGPRTIFVPVGYAEAADRIAAMVNRGALKLQPHWLTKQACQNFIDFLPNGGWADGIMLRATAVQVQVAGDAERSVSPPAAASMTERHDGVCVSGAPFHPEEVRHVA